MIFKYLYVLLAEKRIICFLFLVNLLGTIYGYYWYGWQLKMTPKKFLIFVPDSPTASLFFIIVLLAFFLGKNWRLFEALAIVTMFKYGIWAVVMNLLVLKVNGHLPWQGYMLMISHFAMAVEGLLYAPFYRFKWKHLIIGSVWTLHNDVIDYVFMQFPRYEDLIIYVREIGYFTFWLSMLSIFIAYVLVLRPNRKEWTIMK